MKKIISILLVVLTLFSFATVAFAEGEAAAATYRVYFVYSTADGEQTLPVDVAFGTDLDTVAPEIKSYVHPSDDTLLVKFSHWTSDSYSAGEEIHDLPKFDVKDGDYDGIRFVAKYEYVPNDLKNNVEDKVEDVLGDILPEGNPLEGISDWFTTITELLKKWFSLFVFYIQSFIG
jgi:hypothetical protein